MHPNKKQKTANKATVPPTKPPPPPPPPQPINFDVPGIPADVSIVIFDQEFFVHSALLKIHSSFFRSNLDKTSNGAPNPRYPGDARYQWVTKVKANGEWCLAARPAEGYFDLSGYQGNIRFDQDCFLKILKTLYFQPFEILSVYQLTTLVVMASDYRILALLSRAFDSVVWKSYDFTDEIYKHGPRLLELAAKMRNHLLFRDALCHAAGSWGEPEDYVIQDERLRKIVDKAHGEITELVSTTQNKLVSIIDIEPCEEGKRGVIEEKVYQIIKAEDQPPSLPKYFRQVHEQHILDCTSLLKSNTILDSKYHEAGLSECEDRFLCAWIKSADLPWDSSSGEW